MYNAHWIHSLPYSKFIELTLKIISLFYESSDIDVWYLYDSKVVVIFGNKDARLVETYKVAENVSIFTRCCQAWLAFVFIPDFSYFVKITVVC